MPKQNPSERIALKPAVISAPLLRSPLQGVSESNVVDLVRGRSEGPCIALLVIEDHVGLIEPLVRMMRQQGWQVLDLRFFGRKMPIGRVPDGVFTDLPETDDKVAALQAFGCPIVRLGGLLKLSGNRLPSVVQDRAMAGRMAAEHFAERLFRHVGFVGFGEMEENKLMYEAMRDRAAELGCACHLHRHRGLTPAESALPTNEKTRLRRQELAQWLKDVPKPIGMLAWSDNLGGRICAAANQAGFSIPSDVAVLGYGNKVSDCECTLVPLSSIDPGFGSHATIAVQLMQELLSGVSKPLQPILVSPVGIDVRESTDALAVVDPVVSKALRYMWDHLDLDFGSDYLANVLGTSRRTLERAFRNHLGTSIRAELLRRRVDQLKVLLRTTDLPIADLAPRVGFSSAQYLSNAFRRTVGVAPNQYRSMSHEQKPALMF
jgi:LacI family transcriptional regulator